VGGWRLPSMGASFRSDTGESPIAPSAFGLAERLSARLRPTRQQRRQQPLTQGRGPGPVPSYKPQFPHAAGKRECDRLADRLGRWAPLSSPGMSSLRAAGSAATQPPIVGTAAS